MSIRVIAAVAIFGLAHAQVFGQLVAPTVKDISAEGETNKSENVGGPESSSDNDSQSRKSKSPIVTAPGIEREFVLPRGVDAGLVRWAFKIEPQSISTAILVGESSRNEGLENPWLSRDIRSFRRQADSARQGATLPIWRHGPPA